MNIKINKEQFERLMSWTAMKIPMGSTLYGTKTDKSDTDYLCIFSPEGWGDLGRMPNIHQFQYDDEVNNIDYIFTTLTQFWKNQKSGESTINSDVIMFTNEITEEEGEKIDLCRTYNVLKSYVGFSKRDRNQSLFEDTNKKLFHASRSLYCATSLMENNLPDIYNIQQLHKEPFSYDYLLDWEREVRSEINRMLNKNELKRYFIRETGDDLLDLLLNSNNIKEFKYD